MKKILLVFCAGLFTLVAEAQTKVGTIDVDFILMQMPEIEGVQKNLQQYGETLDKQLDAKMKDYQEKLEDYNNNVNSFTSEQRMEKQTAIFTLEEDISQFRQNGIQLMRLREDELKRPLFQKIAEALDVVANEQNYTQVLNTSADSNLVFLNPNFDITLAVLEKMGIKIDMED